MLDLFPLAMITVSLENDESTEELRSISVRDEMEDSG